RVHQAARAPRRPQPCPHGLPHQGRGGDLGPRVPVERAELAVGAKAGESLLERGDIAPRCRDRQRRLGNAGGSVAGLVYHDPHLGAHGIECHVVNAHDVEVTMGAGAGAGAGALTLGAGGGGAAGAAGALALRTAPPPRAGYTSVTIRLRITTGLLLAVTLPAAAWLPPIAGSLPVCRR